MNIENCFGNPEPVRISPMFNNMFLYLFGKHGSKRLTQCLLNAVLKLAGLPEVEDINEVDEIAADAAIPGGLQARTARCDIVVVTRDGVYDIDAQGRHPEGPRNPELSLNDYPESIGAPPLPNRTQRGISKPLDAQSMKTKKRACDVAIARPPDSLGARCPVCR